jgi:translation initiation factor 1
MRLFAGTPFDRPPRCETCGELEESCVCPPPTEPRTPPAKQTVRPAVEKRKGGKLVTTLRGLRDEGTHLSELLTQLKSACGAGGAVKEGVLELQGDQRDRAAALLRQLGYRVS